MNGLAPYASPSNYFGAGDEPFDGKFTGGEPVEAAFSGDSAIWMAGTWQSEVSQFLVDSNGNADLNEHKEQLAQQLLAFIFNTRHRPTSEGLTQLPLFGLAISGCLLEISLVTRSVLGKVQTSIKLIRLRRFWMV